MLVLFETAAGYAIFKVSIRLLFAIFLKWATLAQGQFALARISHPASSLRVGRCHKRVIYGMKKAISSLYLWIWITFLFKGVLFAHELG